MVALGRLEQSDTLRGIQNADLAPLRLFWLEHFHQRGITPAPGMLGAPPPESPDQPGEGVETCWSRRSPLRMNEQLLGCDR